MSAWQALSHGKQELAVSLREESRAWENELPRSPRKHFVDSLLVSQMRETGFPQKTSRHGFALFRTNHGGQTSYWLVLLEH